MQNVVNNVLISESSALGGVEAKDEIAGDDEMSKNPSDDLPNQEKNQYWTVHWWKQGRQRNGARKYLDKETYQKISDLLENGKTVKEGA